MLQKQNNHGHACAVLRTGDKGKKKPKGAMKGCRLQDILKHVGAGHRLLQNRRDQITKKKKNIYIYI